MTRDLIDSMSDAFFYGRIAKNLNPGVNPGIPGLRRLNPEIPGLANGSGIAIPNCVRIDEIYQIGRKLTLLVS